MRLNYRQPGDYDFNGGWGSKNSEIMMPISPRHLLYVKVGSKSRNRFTVSQEETRYLQRFIVERAHRWIFAKKKLGWVAKDKSRIVDQAQFNAEQKAWKEWHDVQLKIEMD